VLCAFLSYQLVAVDLVATLTQLLDHLVEATTEVTDFVVAIGKAISLAIRAGAPVGNFRKTWASVCVAAGVGWFHCPTCDEKIPVNSDGSSIHCGRELRRSDLKYRGLIFHDLRRSAVRGLIRAGVGQKTAMSITGHKTMSVFQRYQIVSPADKQEATRMLEVSQEAGTRTAEVPSDRVWAGLGHSRTKRNRNRCNRHHRHSTGDSP
jgi:hypothetical protein